MLYLLQKAMVLNTSLKWGIILGLAVALGTQILTWLGLGLTNWFVGLTYLLVVVVIILSSRELKKAHNGKLSFGNAALAVLIIVLIGRVLFQSYMFIYTRYIEPEWVNQVAEVWTQMMQEQGDGIEKINQQIAAFRKGYETGPMFTLELIKYAIPQLVLGLITSLVFVLPIRRKEQ